MRIYITTTPNKESVPFNYQHRLNGVIHKWLGTNELHGKLSLRSCSWLLNAHAGKSGLDYPNGAKFFLSFYDDTCTKQVIESILSNAEMCFGMRAVDVTIKENPDLTHQTLFQCASPFFIRRREGDRDIHYTYKDEDAGKFLEETLLHKMAEAGLSRDESLKIHFDVSSPAAKIKIISYRGIKNKVSLCPVIIEGCPETKLFAWNVGLGNSTGIGFGAIDL